LDDYSPQLDDRCRSAADMALEIAVAVLVAARDPSSLNVAQLAHQALDEIAVLVPASINPTGRRRILVRTTRLER